MKQSKSVKYIKANTLMSEMEQARIKSTNLDYLNKLTKLDLLVIDDFGLMDLDLDKCRDFFEVLDTRDGRKSTVVISQFPVSTWFDMFADNTYADACLTRITDKHHTSCTAASVLFVEITIESKKKHPTKALDFSHIFSLISSQADIRNPLRYLLITG